MQVEVSDPVSPRSSTPYYVLMCKIFTGDEKYTDRTQVKKQKQWHRNQMEVQMFLLGGYRIQTINVTN